MDHNRYKLGLIGFGYWGPILLRNFHSNPRISVTQVCDRNPQKLEKVAEICRSCTTTLDARQVIGDPAVDVVAVATQAGSHFELVEQALLRNKHVFVEKPFTLNVEQAKRLIHLAEERRLLIMVDHPHLFQPDHGIIKRIIEAGEIGNVLHFHSTRADFGLFQTDTNIIWHSLYHDIYIILDLFPHHTICSVLASGFSHVVPGVHDTAVVSLGFNEPPSADFVVSWLFPQKERKIIIAGDRKIIHWDYTAPAKIQLYHKAARYQANNRTVEYDLDDSVQVPACETVEALNSEVDYFVDCLDRRVSPHNDGNAALRVMQVLQRIGQTLQNPAGATKTPVASNLNQESSRL